MRAARHFISRSVHRCVDRGAVLALVSVLTTSCAKPVVIYRSPAEALAAEYGRALRLQTVTGERYTIYQGTVRNDTLHAIRIGTPAGSDSTVAIALSDVSSLTRVDRGISAATAGTVGFGVGFLAGTLIILGLTLAIQG